MKKIALVVAALGAIAAAPLAAQTVVDIDGRANASTDGSNAVTADFLKGKYRYTFVSGAFDAFSRFSGNEGCNATGARCRQGFENSVVLNIDGTNTFFGDGGAGGGFGPQGTGGYYDTAARSLGFAGKYVGTFTLSAPTTVGFFLYDNQLGDNRGGVSLAISAVPEPATWALMIMGFGAVGGVTRRRAKARLKVSFA